MLKTKIIISICVSVLAMFVFEAMLNGVFLPVGSSSVTGANILKYFAPSVIASMFVALPMAANYRPGSFKLCTGTVFIWVILDFLLLQGNTIISADNIESVLFLTVAFGPKLLAIVIFLLAGYIADNKLARR